MKLLKRIFRGYDGCSPDEKSQYGVLFSFFAFTFFLLLGFSFINDIHGRELLAYIQMISAVMVLPWLILGFKKRWLPYPRELLLAVLFVNLVLLVVDGGIANTGIYWAQIYPFAAFMLMGLRIGWYWCGTFMLFYALLLIAHALNLLDLSYEHETLDYAPIMYLVFTVIACLLEISQEKRQSKLIASEKRYIRSQAKLEETVALRTKQLQQINEKLSREVDEKIEAIQKYELTEMKFQHSQKMESLGTLVGGIAHDFNNMLSGITANLYLLQRKIDQPDLKKRLDKIGDLSMHAAEIIRQLTTFARKDEVELKVFDLRTFIKEAFKLARVSIPAHIRSDLMVVDGEQVIRGEATQIQQVLMNLMNNARDAVADAVNPFISVSLTSCDLHEVVVKGAQEIPAGQYAVLSVQDNGCGMEEEMLGRIFEPFFTTKQVGAGTGLGLSMVYGAVQTHGAYIDVVSYPGSGTRFSIYFPVIQAEQHTSAGDIQVLHGENEKILLVDDDPQLLDATKHLLHALGYSVITASDGLKAVEIFKSRQDAIDLILMDVVMPGLSGPAAADMIREIDADAKILFLTGYDRDHEATCELVGAWERVLNKPVTVDELSRVIRDTLTRSDT